MTYYCISLSLRINTHLNTTHQAITTIQNSTLCFFYEHLVCTVPQLKKHALSILRLIHPILITVISPLLLYHRDSIDLPYVVAIMLKAENIVPAANHTLWMLRVTRCAGINHAL
jgi:hypothetical protein